MTRIEPHLRRHYQSAIEASLNGDLDVLKRLKAEGFPLYRLNTKICHFAAWKGHLDVVVWAREHGYPWSKEVCSVAAIGGHLDVLQWLVENGCTWYKPDCLAKAQRHGHTAMAAWIEAQK